MSEYKLKEEIIKRSTTNIWYEAKQEWILDEVYSVDEYKTCLCGHYPIKEICILLNKKNKKKATVGNVCVKKFLGLPSKNIFDAIKRIKEDISKALNPDTLLHAKKKKWVSERDYKFYLDTWRKRDLSVKQLKWRVDINKRILRNIRKQ